MPEEAAANRNNSSLADILHFVCCWRGFSASDIQAKKFLLWISSNILCGILLVFLLTWSTIQHPHSTLNNYKTNITTWPSSDPDNHVQIELTELNKLHHVLVLSIVSTVLLVAISFVTIYLSLKSTNITKYKIWMKFVVFSVIIFQLTTIFLAMTLTWISISGKPDDEIHILFRDGSDNAELFANFQQNHKCCRVKLENGEDSNDEHIKCPFSEKVPNCTTKFAALVFGVLSSVLMNVLLIVPVVCLFWCIIKLCKNSSSRQYERLLAMQKVSPPSHSAKRDSATVIDLNGQKVMLTAYEFIQEPKDGASCDADGVDDQQILFQQTVTNGQDAAQRINRSESSDSEKFISASSQFDRLVV